jgi:hypothetical protein
VDHRQSSAKTDLAPRRLQAPPCRLFCHQSATRARYARSVKDNNNHFLLKHFATTPEKFYGVSMQLNPLLKAVISGALIAVLAVPAMAQKTVLSVYTALENDQLGPYKKAFETAHPEVEIAWVRDSTGIMTARILAEKDNPRADVIWGLGASSIALFDSMNMLHAYSPKGVDQIKPAFRSSKTPEVDPKVRTDLMAV